MATKACAVELAGARHPRQRRRARLRRGRQPGQPGHGGVRRRGVGATRSGARAGPHEIAAAVRLAGRRRGVLRHRRRAARRRRGHRGHRRPAPAPHPRHRAAAARATERRRQTVTSVRHRRGGRHRRHPRPPPGPRRATRSPSSTPTRSTSRRIRADGLVVVRGDGAQRGPGWRGPSPRTGRRGRGAWTGSCSRSRRRPPAAALDWIAPRLAEDGFVVSLQNGLNEDTIARTDRSRTARSARSSTSSPTSSGRARSATAGTGALVVGELDGRDSRPGP